MKFKIERNVLSEALFNAAKASSARSSIPALEGVLIHLSDGKITVTGYDLEMGIKCIVEPLEAEEDGEVVVNAKVFGEMIRKMPAGPVELLTENEINVTLRSGSVVYNVVGVSGDQYPNIPELRNDVTFYIGEALLKSMIRQTYHAIATTEIKAVHMGSKFHIEKNRLSVVSVDGVRMAKRDEDVEYDDIDFVVPSKTLGELLRILSDQATEGEGDDAVEKKIAVCIDRSQICFSRDDYVIISRLLEGNFIDYNRIMSFAEETSAVLNAREFAESLDRTLLLNTDRYKCPVICTFENDLLTIDIKTALGKMNDQLKIKYSGAKLEIAFNAKYMIDSLRNSECDEVRIDFCGPLAPIRVRPLNDDSYVGIVLPVRNK
ncbi:MAG: DNA polymerase III subunit beta [Bacteroides sp.]|nr:DNA polymerase III subunit beta [Eubacterium sp.]MCM1418914.1 DNA polymerase III subunit beta [Roseburia sp.]MCM1461522.1 DNA polymerase III subunit beta [Bacteroides sp.]